VTRIVHHIDSRRGTYRGSHDGFCVSRVWSIVQLSIADLQLVVSVQHGNPEASQSPPSDLLEEHKAHALDGLLNVTQRLDLLTL